MKLPLRFRHDALALAEAAFVERHPAYRATRCVDRLRATEYARFDAQSHTYLDYTGGGVYAESQLREHAELLQKSIYGNPHSGNPASLAMTDLVERTRASVLEYFGASSDEYIVIFSPNATGALKLVAEAYPFASGGCYLVAADNHNSVNGIREFARRGGADVVYAPLAQPDLRLDDATLVGLLEKQANGPRLFAFPAQSNFTGVQHSLAWIDTAHQLGWDVLLDAAAFVPSNRLDLSRWRPDFVSMSFYKMFGYPTGVGALVARREAVERLRRPWFSGGTITFSSVCAAADEGSGFYLSPGVARFEDGTVNYLSLPAVEIGLRWIASVGVELIKSRTRTLTAWLLETLQDLRHANGQPVVHVYGPRDTQARGPTVALNFVDPDGCIWDCWHVEQLANARRLSLRAGCHCNPGAREAALGYTRAHLDVCFRNKECISFREFQEHIRGRVSGVARVSLGVASNFADVYRFGQFARDFVDRPATVVATVPE
jgi:molybdenum cofactor sulfurtransferase